jgi:competence protein ComEA
VSLTARDGGALAAGALGVLVLAVAAWLILGPALSAGPPAEDPFSAASFPLPEELASSDEAPSAELVVDVQGGVVHPGVVTLPAGARVADAIAAAGGYAPTADLLAAASSLNLAAKLQDGDQVYVPLAGVAGGGGGGGGGDGGTGGTGGGLLNLNTASPEELEALPGIGPVTVQKIVAARAERSFASLDELVERKVLNRGQLEDIRDLVTV